MSIIDWFTFTGLEPTVNSTVAPTVRNFRNCNNKNPATLSFIVFFNNLLKKATTNVTNLAFTTILLFFQKFIL